MSNYSPHTYLVVYCFTFLALGLYVSSIGALIPYLSEERGKLLTDYSFLFVARTIGCVIGYLYYRKIKKQTPAPNQHEIMIVSGIGFLIFMIMFVVWKSTLGEWIGMVTLGIMYYMAFTSVNVALIRVSGKKANQWVALGHANFGIGALIAPLIIRVLSVDIYLYGAFLFLAVSAVCYYIPNPEHSEEDSTIPKEQQKPKIEGTYNLHLVASLMIFLNMGITLTVPAWFPSYAIMEGVADKEASTIYGTIYWTMNTSFKLLTALWTASALYKLNFYFRAALLNGVVCLLLHYTGNYDYSSYAGTILYGISNSSTFAMLLALPGEYGIFFNSEHTATMMISTNLSSGVISGIAGIMMEYDPVSLLVGLFALSIFLFLLLDKFTQGLEILSKSSGRQFQLKEALTDK